MEDWNNYGSFFASPQKWKKSEFWKNKNCWRFIFFIFTHMYQKPQSYKVQFLRYGKKDFCHFGPFFALYHLTTLKIKNLKKKNSWIYHHFTQMYHKWHSYDAWFLRYETWQTEFFVILGHFLSFYHTNNTKIQNLKKMKKSTWKYHILHKCTKNLFYLF